MHAIYSPRSLHHALTATSLLAVSVCSLVWEAQPCQTCAPDCSPPEALQYRKPSTYNSTHTRCYACCFVSDGRQPNGKRRAVVYTANGPATQTQLHAQSHISDARRSRCKHKMVTHTHAHAQSHTLTRGATHTHTHTHTPCNAQQTYHHHLSTFLHLLLVALLHFSVALMICSGQNRRLGP